jgi:hypothetical protein
VSQTEPHDEFLELCAVSTSGQLTEEEQRKLQVHLAVCPACRESLKQYEAIVAHGIPAMAAEQASENLDPGPGWSEERAEAALFKRIADEKKTSRPQMAPVPGSNGRSQAFAFSSAATWRNIWALYAAGILLFITLGVLTYQVGTHRGTSLTKIETPHRSAQTQISLEEKVSDTAHEREIATGLVEQRERLIADLRAQLQRQSSEISLLQAARGKLEAELRNEETGRQDLAQQRTEVGQKLTATQANVQDLQQKLDSLTQQSSGDSARASALEAKVNDLTRQLHDREAVAAADQELLDHDRDIRNLMGARDLYIAEVYDVNRSGTTQKPFGRVFYTKGKSLIFYAYDLDQQNEVKNASTFQAWGRRGPDRQQALALGVFFEDNISKKRWVLKLDDPRVLAQIDAVFVTVEPNGGSRKPSGKPLLFAYLRVDPNHP